MFGKHFIRRAFAISLVSILLLIFLPKSPARSKSPLTVFSNTAPITINTASSGAVPFPATLYPSQIDVSGMTGTITKVEVTLKGVTHTASNQMDFLLVSPGNLKYIFLSDAGGTNLVEDQVYTFTDTAATVLPNPPTSGTYLPTSGDLGADTFPAPAPAGPYSQPPNLTFASVFNGSNPNGAWTLYAVDDTFNVSFTEAGSINTGWTVTITTDGAPQTFANSNYIGLNDVLTTATPYASVINVSGLTGVISNLKVSLTGLSHTNTPDIDILLVSPNGKGSVLLSDAGNFSVVSGVNLIFDDTAASNVGVPIVSGTFMPTDISAGAIETFPNPAPLRPYHNFGQNQLSNFNGYNPNGEWRLFVIDDAAGNSGSISGGWSIDITTVPTPPPVLSSCSAPSFSTAAYPTGTKPTNIAAALFNNDANIDVAVTNQVSNDVSILLGNGDGTLGTQSLVAAGSSPYAIAAGKFNADNFFDLAVVNSGSNNVSILLGNGDGTFSAPTNFNVGSGPLSVAVADFNNDTKQDLAVSNFGGFFAGTVSILLGNGSGGFTPGNTVITRTQPAFVAAANINGDANQDIIIANFGSNDVSTFFGAGNGTFQLSQNINILQNGPVAIEVANYLGGDSFPDFAVADYNGDAITNCQGSAAGTFTCSNANAGGSNPISITSGDYVGNGIITLATALSGSNLVKVLTSSVNVGQNPNAVETADFNGDNKPDLVTANSGSNNLSVLINSCLAAKGNLFDFNGDRRTDISVWRPGKSEWYIQSLIQSTFSKVFARPTDIPVPADYNGDNLTDYAFYRPENGLWHVIDTNSGPIHYLQFGLAGDIPVPADYDGDGKDDIAVWRPSEGNWYIRRSTDHSLQVAHFGLNGDKPVAADYDGDGSDDIAVYRPAEGTWYIFRSLDSQVFIRQFGISEDKTVAGDYDGDGKADIAVWRPSTGTFYILRSSDDDYRIINWGTVGDLPVVGDFEGDGKFDYAVWRPSDRYWYVLKSSDNGAMFVPWGIPGDFLIPGAYVR